MTQKTVCDFCGGDAGHRGSSKVSVVPNTGGGFHRDACSPCTGVVTDALKKMKVERPDVE